MRGWLPQHCSLLVNTTTSVQLTLALLRMTDPGFAKGAERNGIPAEKRKIHLIRLHCEP